MIRTYLALTVIAAAPFYYLIISAGSVSAGGGVYVLGLMWSPGVSALLTRLLLQRNVRGMGWGWGKTRYQVWSYLIVNGHRKLHRSGHRKLHTWRR